MGYYIYIDLGCGYNMIFIKIKKEIGFNVLIIFV